MLQAANISKRYGDFTVLNNVSLNVPKGQFVSIVGPSGAGKSTLLHLIGALDKADSGQLFMNEVDIFSLSKKKQTQWRNEQVGFVFQFHHLLPEFTALENIAMPLWIQGVSQAKGLARAQEFLEFVGLKNKGTNKPNELSGGEQQRVAIARALVTSPSLILADEPTGNLDSNNAQLIHDLFLETQSTYQPTIIMVTHNEGLAGLTHRSIHMRDGSIVEDVSHA